MPYFADEFRSTIERTHGQSTNRSRSRGLVSTALTLVAGAYLAVAAGMPSHAQAQELSVGEAFVTQFSGTSTNDDGTPIIDIDGIVAQAIDLRNPGGPADGSPWRNAPKKLQIKAGDIGQVFGVAFDDQSPANVYLAATSVFGLHWDEAAGAWMEGQWGPDGDPGTIYKLNAANNYQPEIFAHVTLDGRVNSGAGLGNITFNRASSNLYVSDLESGLIFRLDLDGNVLDRFDHGVSGREQFVDAETGTAASLPAIAFDPDSAAQVDACESGTFANTPQCWNLADYRRRVWGMSTHSEPAGGQTRLYYAVWSSQGFGNPTWAVDFSEQQNTIWSVGLEPDGSFRANDVRREFTVPGFSATAEDYARIGGSHPVSDIAISSNGEMALAERGGLRNLGLAEDAPFSWPDEARLLRARQNVTGQWVPIGRNDISWHDRKDLGLPYIRAASSGGVDFGYGYTPAGSLDSDANDGFIWASGDRLCRPESPCGEGPDSADILNGLQGQPADSIAELNPDAAFGDYPDVGPATPAVGPGESYFVETSGADNPNWNGDIEIFKAQSAPGEPDLAVSKNMPEICVRGGLCTAEIEIINVGGGNWIGPLYLRDITAPVALGFAAVSPPWQCAPVGGETACYHPPLNLASGQSVSLIMELAIANNFAHTNINNCAVIDWPLADPGNPANIVAAVQKALTLLGYNPGPIDGAMGPLTAAAIAQAQTDFGLAATGVIDSELFDVLFSGYSILPGDANPANDEACDNSDIVGTPPPGGVHLPVGSRPGHLAPGSIHQPIGSGPAHVFPNSVHLPIGSGPAHIFPNSIHLPIGSGPAHIFPNSIHLPIGSNPGHLFPQSIHFPIGSNLGHNFPLSIHLPLGSNPGHLFPQSIHLPLGSNPGHNFPQSIHFPIGSNLGHNFPQSIHLPLGSNPGHNFPQSIHFPIGSNLGHNFPQSIHLPLGSNPGHNFPQSIHLPLGSNPGHNFPQSIHLPIGSNPGHNFPQSIHLPLGSNPGHQLPQSIHLPIGSNPGHNFPQSIHLPLGSNPGHQLPQSIHLPIGSNPGHNFPQSIHLPIGSNPGHQFPQSLHLPIGSNLQHNPGNSIHTPIGSGGGHNFPNSLHLPLGSAGHAPAGSLHLPVGSVGQLPAGSLHAPVASNPLVAPPVVPGQQIHQPVGSKPQIHLPIGSKPQVTNPAVHKPTGSKPQVHKPTGSKPQVHKPVGSKPQVHLPIGSRPQVHKPVGSKPQIHLPIGSKTQIHLPIGSKPQVHKPRGSKPQLHQPAGSTLQLHLPIGSKPKVHQPRGSRQKKPNLNLQQQSGSKNRTPSKNNQGKKPVLLINPKILNNLKILQD